ncbi:unnamed protein product, partial [Symbiodinium sp. CCMP2456]
VGSFKLSSIPLNVTGLDAGNMSEVDETISKLIAQGVVGEMQDVHGMPDPKENGDKGGGMGELGKSLEFLMLKVAQLETLAELQQVELGMQRVLIEKMQKKMNFDDAEVSLVQKSSEESVQEAHDILKRVVQKHMHQREHREYHLEAQPQPKHAVHEEEKAEEVEIDSRRALLQKRRIEWGPIGKVVKSGVKYVEKGAKYAHKGVSEAVKAVDGTGLTGGALTEAYNAAAKAGNAAKFLANTAISSVEMAANLITASGSWGASCSNAAPSLGRHGTRFDINFGHQRCSINLLNNHLTLFDFNWGRKSIDMYHFLPEPVKLVASTAYEAIRTVFSVGWELMHCPHRGHHHQLIACLGGWIQHLAPAVNWMAAPLKLVAGSAYEHFAPPLHWMPNPVKTLANGNIMGLLPGQLNQIASGDIMGLLPGQLNQIASGDIMGLLPGQLNQIASGNIMGLLPGQLN